MNINKCDRIKIDLISSKIRLFYFVILKRNRIASKIFKDLYYKLVYTNILWTDKILFIKAIYKKYNERWVLCNFFNTKLEKANFTFKKLK
jgi:hypothetical protein